MCLDEMNNDLPWVEKVCISQELEGGVKAEDDLNRELMFYKACLSGVSKGRNKLEQLKIPYLRPQDYFAEMVKTDTHMERIRRSLEFEEEKMKIVEQRKIDQMQRKFAKKAKQNEKKKTQTNYIKEYKGDQKSLEAALNKETPNEPKEFKKPNYKRLAKNKKYGMGKKTTKKQTKEGYNNVNWKDFNKNRKRAKGKK